MRRRVFLALLGRTAISAPRGVSAQTGSRTYRLGLFTAGAPLADTSVFGAPLIRGLQQRGYSVGGNLMVSP